MIANPARIIEPESEGPPNTRMSAPSWRLMLLGNTGGEPRDRVPSRWVVKDWWSRGRDHLPDRRPVGYADGESINRFRRSQ